MGRVGCSELGRPPDRVDVTARASTALVSEVPMKRKQTNEAETCSCEIGKTPFKPPRSRLAFSCIALCRRMASPIGKPRRGGLDVEFAGRGGAVRPATAGHSEAAEQRPSQLPGPPECGCHVCKPFAGNATAKFLPQNFHSPDTRDLAGLGWHRGPKSFFPDGWLGDLVSWRGLPHDSQ